MKGFKRKTEILAKAGLAAIFITPAKAVVYSIQLMKRELLNRNGPQASCIR